MRMAGALGRRRRKGGVPQKSPRSLGSAEGPISSPLDAVQAVDNVQRRL